MRIALALAIVLAAMTLAACGTTASKTSTATPTNASKTPHPPEAPTDPVANKLADLQAGHHLAGSDPLVRGIARHLSSLHRKCRGTEAQVAGFIDFAATDLAKYGIYQTRSSLAAQLDKNINGFPPNFDCQGFVASYLVLRETK